MNLTKEVQDLYAENENVAVRNVRRYKRMERPFHAHGLEDSISLRWQFSPN